MRALKLKKMIQFLKSIYDVSAFCALEAARRNVIRTLY